MMKTSLLLAAAALCGLTATAGVPQVSISGNHHYKVNASVSRQLKADNPNVKVISERTLIPGVTEQVCALPGGAAYKRIVKAGAPALKSVKAPAVKETTEALLNEGFEGWDGLTKNWIPATWTEINSTGEAGTYGDGDFTWYVSAQNGTLPNPVEGKYYCIIPYAQVTREDGNKEDLAQDEWLVTPKVTPRTNEQLSFTISYSPLFLYDMSSENVDYSTMSFKKQIVSATMKLYVRENGGQWQEIYDIEPAWHEKTLNDLFNNYFSQLDEEVIIPLADFEGKEVEFAFRYVGLRGNTMELDQVIVDKAKLTAGYNRPAGAMYWGFSKNLEYPAYDTDANQGLTLLHVPAFTDLTWTNASSKNVTAQTWTYTDGITEDLTSADKDLVANFAPSRNIEGIMSTPKLTVSAPGFSDAKFNMPVTGMYAGGAPEIDGALHPLTLANLQVGDANFLYEQGVPLSGFHKYTQRMWTNILLGKSPTETDYYAPLGFITKFEKPTTPYIVKRVWVMAYGIIGEGSNFNFILYRCQNNMPYGAFAAAECKYEDIVVTETGSSYKFYAIPFDLTSPEAGAPVTIDRDVMGMVYGLDGNENNTIYLLQTVSYDPQETNSQFIYFTGKEGGENKAFVMSTEALSDASGNSLKTNLYMELETEFPWLQANGVTEFGVGADGGSLALGLDSYKDASELTVAVTDEQGQAIDWITTTGAGKNTDAVITATVLPLDMRATERVAKVKVSYPACKDVEFTITQNAVTGITTVQNSPLAVTVNGDDIFVNGVEGEVLVYDVTGKVVAKAIAHGNATINASLTSGIYLVKAAGKTAKVIK
ncbi:MAG: choice-of-anchor J domain-containing protein [Bacteroidales bacterium]|nr:choice-of-anchor J domain-containing protein [Bacteroidales bacterium]